MRPTTFARYRYPITMAFYAFQIALLTLLLTSQVFAQVVENVLAEAMTKKPTVNISGFWQLDESLSDDPKPMMKDIGKIRENKKKSDGSANGGRQPVGGDTYRRYWEHVSSDKQWRATADAAHGGSIKSLLFNQRLAIAATEHGFKVWYQDGFVRDINPNPYGRVFSANGDELVANDLGRTLSYVKKQKIISETRTKPRGEILETFEPSDNGETLKITIKVDRPDWDKIIKLQQTYRRVANAVQDDSVQTRAAE